MDIKVNAQNITVEDITELYQSNNVELIGNYSIEKLVDSLKNSYLVVSAWENNKLIGFCRVISDGVFFGRIQELVFLPEKKEDEVIITNVLEHVFEKCPDLKSFHLNPGVIEKKGIYKRKHSPLPPNLRKIFWAIHEDEF